jgi:hypothetical protein
MQSARWYRAMPGTTDTCMEPAARWLAPAGVAPAGSADAALERADGLGATGWRWSAAWVLAAWFPSAAWFLSAAGLRAAPGLTSAD